VGEIGAVADGRAHGEEFFVEGVVAGEGGDGAVAEAVDAAVADVADDGAVAAGEQGRDGGAHRAEPPRAGRGDVGVGELDPRGEQVAVEVEAGVEGEGPGDVVVEGVAPHEVLQRVDGEARGHLAAVVAAHAVGDGVEPRGVLGAVAVLVVGAATDVGASGAGDVHGGCSFWGVPRSARRASL
jgi:hypothetical protein